MRRLLALLLLVVLTASGCGGSDGGGGSAGPGLSPTAGGPAPTSTSTAGAAAVSCPTENTRRFAKTRFAADVGGAAFLIRRYVYRPYRDGAFARGAQGRRTALVKAAAASAASAKLLKNATENARANPTLCRTVSVPLAQLTGTLDGLVGQLRSGRVDPALVGGLGGAVTGLLETSDRAGVPVEERPTSRR